MGLGLSYADERREEMGTVWRGYDDDGLLRLRSSREVSSAGGKSAAEAAVPERLYADKNASI